MSQQPMICVSLTDAPGDVMYLSGHLRCWWKLTPEGIAWLEAKARAGASDKQLAYWLRLTDESFKALCEHQKGVAEALARGRAAASKK
jgi:hypothetical protein